MSNQSEFEYDYDTFLRMVTNLAIHFELSDRLNQSEELRRTGWNHRFRNNVWQFRRSPRHKMWLGQDSDSLQAYMHAGRFTYSLPETPQQGWTAAMDVGIANIRLRDIPEYSTDEEDWEQPSRRRRRIEWHPCSPPSSDADDEYSE